MVPDYKRGGVWMQTFKHERTRSSVKWWSIRSRCKVGGNASYATYAGCSLAEEFMDFQLFTDWHTQQVGYGSDYHVDKDLLDASNKVYSPSQCLLIPPELNLFIRPNVARRGILPQGVSYDTKRDKYVVGISHKNKAVYIGRFDSVEEARKAYCEEKDRQAYDWYLRLSSGEFIVDNKVVDAMKGWNTDDRYK